MVVAAVVVQVSSQCTVGNVHNSPCILIQYQIWGEGGKKKTSGAFGAPICRNALGGRVATMDQAGLSIGISSNNHRRMSLICKAGLYGNDGK